MPLRADIAEHALEAVGVGPALQRLDLLRRAPRHRSIGRLSEIEITKPVRAALLDFLGHDHHPIRISRNQRRTRLRPMILAGAREHGAVLDAELCRG
jgi:hypothetical protein